MFAAIDSLLGALVFILISAVAAWLQKKQRHDREGGAPGPPSRPTRGAGVPPPPVEQPSSTPLSWEEELRRLLKGRTTESAPLPTPPAPPPPILTQPRRAEVLQPRRLPPVVAETTPAPQPSSVQVVFKPLSSPTQSAQTYAEASTMEARVPQHMHDLTLKPVQMTAVQQRISSKESTTALELVRNPQSVRAAVLASLILGPPRALSEYAA